MEDNLFRFALVRPPQRNEPLENNDYIDPYRSSRYEFIFYGRLLNAISMGGRNAARIEADKYILEGTFVKSLSNLQIPLAQFDREIDSLGFDPAMDKVIDTIRNVFGNEPAEVLKLESYQTARLRLGDSLAVTYFASVLPVPRVSHLIRGLRLCELLERIVDAVPDILVAGGVDRVLRAPIVLPFENELVPTQLSQDHSGLQPLYRLWANRGIHLYTTSVSERDNAIIEDKYVDEGVACYFYSQAIVGTIPLYRLYKDNNYLYTTSASERDSAIDQDYANDGVAGYVYSQAIAGAIPLYRLNKLADHFYTTSISERDSAVTRYGYVYKGIACYVLFIVINAGAVKPAGISDLLVVRQTLRRYERGEIAHVENALKGEFKERTYRRTQTTETLLLQETETTTQQEHDLQSTERFELKTEVSKTIQEDLRTQAGFSVSGSYGTVTASATGEFAFGRSVEEATRTASSYARDVVERSQNRVQERTMERRSTRSVVEIEEVAKHGLDNRGESADHIVGIYRWIDKVYEAQIVNYGKRLMLEFYVPEPAAYHRTLETSRHLTRLTTTEPENPVVQIENGSIEKLRPELVQWPEAQKIAAKYGAVGIQPPPAPIVFITATLEVPLTDRDYDKAAAVARDVNGKINRVLPALGSTASKEIKIPKGYIAVSARGSGERRAYIRADPETARDLTFMEKWVTSPGELLEKLEKLFGGAKLPPIKASLAVEDHSTVSIGSITRALPEDMTNINVNLDRISDTLPIAVITSAAGLVVTFLVECHRTIELVQEWQIATYEAIMRAYFELKAQHEEEVARLKVEQGVQIHGRPPAENRKLEQRELKRSAISILTGQHFDDFQAIADSQSQDRSQSPKIAFTKAAAEGNIVQYFEQVFEWHNMTYLFYPYFWGRKSLWPEVLGQESTDPLFVQFLQAGYARVQVPVRPNYEKIVLYFLSSSKLWQEAEDAPVAKPYLPLVEEIRNQTGDDFTIGVGTLNIQRQSVSVTGSETNFIKEDINREIRIAGKVYRIVSVPSPTELTLAKPFKEASDTVNIAYSLGPKLVGSPWEVRLPTTLVMIDKPDVTLPSWAED